VSCAEGSNTPEEFRCGNPPYKLHSDDVAFLENTNFPTIRPPQPRFAQFEIPDSIFEDRVCKPFTFSLDFTQLGTHNDLLPQIPINLETFKVQFEPTGNEFYFKDYNKIRKSPDNSIVILDDPNRKFANFVTTPDLTFIEYEDSVITYTGDADGVNYLVSGRFSLGSRSINSIWENAVGIIREGMAWNLMTSDFTPIEYAHSTLAMDALGLTDYTPETYTFIYIIENRSRLHVLTLWGFQTYEIELKDYVDIQEIRPGFGYLIVPGFPDYNEMRKNIRGPIDRLVVSDIWEKRYNINHRPYFLDHIEIKELVSPTILDEVWIPAEGFFAVPSRQFFKNDILFE